MNLTHYDVLVFFGATGFLILQEDFPRSLGE